MVVGAFITVQVIRCLASVLLRGMYCLIGRRMDAGIITRRLDQGIIMDRDQGIGLLAGVVMAGGDGAVCKRG
jgi:hypothetical protein